MRQASALLPHLKITDLLLEVDDWTGFSRQFTHLKSGESAPDRPLLLTAILADAINLGLAKMAESCPGTSYARLSWLHAWYIRDETYTAALARAVFFNRLGELRDRSFENQRYRASGLNLVIAAIIVWNTVYLGRAVEALRARGQVIDDDLLQHLSPLGWEHINLTGDYTWRPSDELRSNGYRPLRSVPEVSP